MDEESAGMMADETLVALESLAGGGGKGSGISSEWLDIIDWLREGLGFNL